MGMFDNDIIYGGEQLQPNVKISTGKDVHEYVLWDAGIVAENVATSLGADGTKAELVISEVMGRTRGKAADGGAVPTSSAPAKFGTFASSIVEKIKRKGDGDLPAVIKFEVIPTKDAAKQDAFVMAFVRAWDGSEPATNLPPLSPYINSAGAPAAQTSTRTDESGRSYVDIGGERVYSDGTPQDPTGADHPLN